MKKVLVVDIGGTNVKAMLTRGKAEIQFRPGPYSTPASRHA
jgi:predicted NBD/HSP70 family sugar kinase